MKESMYVAYTNSINYIDTNKEKYNIEDVNLYINENFKNGFHIHVADIGTSKNGPSAGCAFTVCFISCILNKKINREIGITGEIDLLMNVTKIGGLEFKLTGAKRSGIKFVLVSYENKYDIEKIIQHDKDLITDDFKYGLIENID